MSLVLTPGRLALTQRLKRARTPHKQLPKDRKPCVRRLGIRGRSKAMLAYTLLACVGGALVWSARGDVFQGMDPVEMLENIANMSPEQQSEVLLFAGEMIKQQNNMDCNIFGGEEECKRLPSTFEFAKTCKGERDMKVDCVYYSDAEKGLSSNPSAAIEEIFGSSYRPFKKACPECTQNLQSLWCVQTVPACGSFDHHVRGAILPAVHEYQTQKDAGLPDQVAFSAVVPDLVRAMSKSMACREMCIAAFKTCNCWKEGEPMMTFGEALTFAEENAGQIDMLGETFKRGQFELLWDTPLCDIFTDSSDPEFTGTCEPVSDVCHKQQEYCDLLENSPDGTPMTWVVATQIAKSVFGFLDGPKMVLQQDLVTRAATRSRATPAPSKHTRSSSPRRQHGGDGHMHGHGGQGGHGGDGHMNGHGGQGGHGGDGHRGPRAHHEGPGHRPDPSRPDPKSHDIEPRPEPAHWDGTERRAGDTEVVQTTAPDRNSSLLGVITGVLVGMISLAAVASVVVVAWRKYQEHKIFRFGSYEPVSDFELLD